MRLGAKLGVGGRIRAVIRNPGEPVQVREWRNLVLDTAFDYILGQLDTNPTWETASGFTTSYPHLAVGSDGTAPVAGDPSVRTYLTHVPVKAATTPDITSNESSWQSNFGRTFTVSNASGAAWSIAEMGLCDWPNARYFSRSLVTAPDGTPSPIALANGGSMDVTYTVYGDSTALGDAGAPNDPFTAGALSVQVTVAHRFWERLLPHQNFSFPVLGVQALQPLTFQNGASFQAWACSKPAVTDTADAQMRQYDIQQIMSKTSNNVIGHESTTSANSSFSSYESAGLITAPLRAAYTAGTKELAWYITFRNWADTLGQPVSVIGVYEWLTSYYNLWPLVQAIVYGGLPSHKSIYRAKLSVGLAAI